MHVDPRRLAEIFEAAGATVTVEDVRRAELDARRRLHEAIAEGHVGTEPEVWQGYFSELFRLSRVPEAGMELAGRLLVERHGTDHLWTWVEEGTAAALEALGAAGYRLGVVSNADGRIESLLEAVGLRRHFEFVIDSEVVGVEKPDRRIFDEAVRRLGVEADACLYVGDLYTVDYLGATAAGLRAVLVDPLGLYPDRAPTIEALGRLPEFLEARWAD